MVINVEDTLELTIEERSALVELTGRLDKAIKKAARDSTLPYLDIPCESREHPGYTPRVVRELIRNYKSAGWKVEDGGEAGMDIQAIYPGLQARLILSPKK